jgi:hypothetical protein
VRGTGNTEEEPSLRGDMIIRAVEDIPEPLITQELGRLKRTGVN